LAAAVGSVAGCSGGGDTTKHTVVYEVVGRGPADVRYVVDDPDSEGEEAKNVASGWTKSVEVTTPGTLMHMTVYTSPSEAPDETITCRVTLDGKVVDEKTQKRSNVSDALQCEADLSER
jgi:hypothetical protein